MVAIIVQSTVTLFFILTSTFESVLVFSGFVMGLNTFFAVAGVFILRFKNLGEAGYRTWGYPVTPLVFLGLMAWTLVYILVTRPEEGIAGLVVVLIGLALYVATERHNHHPVA